jgi:cytoskeleton protein RodZ
MPSGPQYVVRAVQASWIEIRAGDGKVLVSRVLAPGESAAIAADPRARMVTGNAGGVVIEADGQVSDVLGRVGQVIRDIPLEPVARAAFFAGPREPATAPPPPPGE